ncbi:phage major capsid protein [Paraburkholderia unamae]|uniref:Phage major capsid protein n=1 Tax=Paraburkholderia unamae TaxID=219649 RepID=A0ACC6RQV5_9BURK
MAYDLDVCLSRSARALALSGGDAETAKGFIRRNFGGAQQAEIVIDKGLITTDEITPDSELLGAYGGRIADLVRRRSALGRLEQYFKFQHLRPFVPWLALVSGTSAAWVGEAMLKPIGDTPGFLTVRLPVKKVATILPFTEESLRVANANVDAAIERACVQALVDAVEATLFSAAPGDAATPPGLLTDVAAGAGDAPADLDALLQSVPSDLLDKGIVLVINPGDTPRWLASGLGDHGTLSARDGGFLAGMGCITSTAIPPGSVAWICPGAIAFTDAGALISAARAATLMLDLGDGEGPQMVSLWQNNLRAIRAEHWLNWQPLHDVVGGAITGVFPDLPERRMITPPRATKRTKGA